MNRNKRTMADNLKRGLQDNIPATDKPPRRPAALSRWSFRMAVLGLLAGALVFMPGCLLFHQRVTQNDLLPTGQQPDKILYERSINAIKHGRYTVGRLTLQTLLNTYPDSEYLAKAKLAIANSYYKQGGVAGLTEAVSEYKDFITFFPTAPEAPMAQYRVAMAHFRMMGKPDRDLTQARLAQAEFKEFLLKYSDSPLMPLAQARLREVQQVLADGNYQIARFYYQKRANPAAKSRFKEIVNRFPSFSKAGQACWYLAQTYERMNEPKKAIPYYQRLIALYPLSPQAPKAKEELASLHAPVPQPTLATLARARADAIHNTHLGIFQRIMGTFSSSPNLSATRRGPVVVSNATYAIKLADNAAKHTTGPGSTATVQEASASLLKKGKAVDPGKGKAKAKGGTAIAKNQGTSAQKTKGNSKAGTKTATAAKKKKGPLHVFKEIYPF